MTLAMNAGLSSLHDDLLGGDMMLNDPYRTTNGYHTTLELQQLNARYEETRAARIRAAMFPETLPPHANGNGYDGARSDIGQSTNVGYLAPAAQLLKDAVANLINYQDDAEAAMRVIPELIRLLQDSDPIIVQHAAQMAYQLSRRESARHALINSPELIHAVIVAVGNTRDPDTAKYLTGTLYNLSTTDAGLMAIFRSGGIPALIRLLASPLDTVVYYAITTLHNLLMHLEGAKEEVRIHNGVEAMVPLLTRPHDKFLAILTDCLYLCAAGCHTAKTAIYTCNGTRHIVEIMNAFNYDKLLYTTARLLKVLSVCPHNKLAIVQTGGVQSLQRHLHSSQGPLVKHVLWTIRNLSDTATKEENIDDLLRTLLLLLEVADDDVVTCAAGVLSNLTCNNQRNKQLLCKSSGVDRILTCLRGHVGVEGITEPLLCTLRHLTCRHDFTNEARNEVRIANGFPIITTLLASGRPPVTKAALGVIFNVAESPANIPALRDERAPDGQSIVELSGGILKESADAFFAAQQQGAHTPVWDGVQVLELVECSTIALHALSHEPSCRTVIIRMQLTPVLVRLISSTNENIQREALGVLNELAAEADGAHSIEREGAVQLASEVLHTTKIDAIKSYAAKLVTQLARDKPANYRQAVDKEIAGALNIDGGGDVVPLPQNGNNAMINDELMQDMTYESQRGAYDGIGGGTIDSRMSDAQSQQYGTVGQPMGGRPPPGGWYDTDL